MPNYFAAAKARHPNQLDLFADAPIDPPSQGDSPEAPALPMEGSDAGAQPPQELDSQPLAHALPADGRGADAHQPAGGGVNPGRGTDGGPALRPHQHQESAVPGSLGTGDGRMEGARDRGPPAGTIVCEPDPEPTLSPSRDFRINESHRIGQGSLREKARDNLAAIRVLKKLEGENHDATDEEKRILSRYVGWGAMSAAFDWQPPPEWKQVAQDIKELLTPDEYESARASTPNAHFTSPMVISAIWQAMQRLGIPKGAQILEPAMGVGHFLGMMPDELLPGRTL